LCQQIILCFSLPIVLDQQQILLYGYLLLLFALSIKLCGCCDSPKFLKLFYPNLKTIGKPRPKRRKDFMSYEYAMDIDCDDADKLSQMSSVSSRDQAPVSKSVRSGRGGSERATPAENVGDPRGQLQLRSSLASKVCLYAFVSTYLSVCIFICLCAYLDACLCVFFSLSASLPICPLVI